MERSKKLDSLTSLRFFAAAAIVAIHAHETFGLFDVLKRIPAAQAVSFFFVLSGFILSYAYKKLDSPFKIKRFYVARLARVWPLHAVTTAIWIAIMASHNPEGILYQDGLQKLIANILLIQAWVPIQSWQTSFNGVSWSISVELFFYAAFPLVTVIFRRNWHRMLLIQVLLTTLLIAVCYIPQKDSIIQPINLLYFFPPARALEFLAGVCAFHVISHVSKTEIALTTSQWTVLEILAIAGTVLTMLMTRSFGVPETLGAHAGTYIKITGAMVAFAILISIFSFGKGCISKILSIKPLVFLGEASFALYLCHFPVIYLIQTNPEIFKSKYTGYFSVWGVSLALSILLMVLVERPARKWITSKYETSNRDNRTFNLATTTLIVIFVIGATHVTNSVITETNPKTIYLNKAADLASFECGAMVNGITITKTHSNYSSIQINTNNKCYETPLYLAVHLNNKNGDITKNIGSFIIEKSKDNEATKTYINVKNNDLDDAYSIAFAAYVDSNSLITASSRITDWSGKRAVFPLQDSLEGDARITDRSSLGE